MKTIKFPLIVAIALTAVFSFAACSDDDDVDNTKPVINLIDPAEGELLKIGESVHFDVEFSDDVQLKSYKVDIHSAAGHTHTKLASESASGEFSFRRSWDLPAQKEAKIHHHEIEIPATAPAGKYHFMVYCLDAAGNESYVVRNVELSHDVEGGGHGH